MASKVRDEINKYAATEDKEILLWLLSRYHMASDFNFVAKCKFEGRYPQTKRIWYPTEEGRILFNQLKE